MNGLGPGCLASLDNPVGDEITLGGGGRADMDRFVSHLDMHGVAIGVRIDRYRGNAHLACRLDDATGDLATIGDQYLVEHGRRFLR